MIHIYGKRTPTTLTLAQKLNCKVSMRCLPTGKVLIINWGWSYGQGLNSRIIGNKQVEFEILHKAGLTPETWRERPTNKENYPILGRLRHHTHGNDIIFIKTPNQPETKPDEIRIRYSDFYVKYIDKLAEFRAHVCGDKVVLITKKLAKDDKSDPIVWNHNRGYSQCTYPEGKKYWKIVSDIAIKAIKVVKYDFGAVDIIVDKNGKAYVLEVNSAPGLIVDNRIESYIEYFKSMEKKICQTV